MWDCGSPLESAERTSHEPSGENQKIRRMSFFPPPTAAYHAKCASSHSGTQRLLIKTAKLDSHGEALTESLCFVPCCKPGAGQCSCSHPAVSGQPWLGEEGWLDSTEIIIPSFIVVNTQEEDAQTKPFMAITGV